MKYTEYLLEEYLSLTIHAAETKMFSDCCTPSSDSERKKHYLDPKPEQWNIIEKMCKALEPFEDAAVFLCGQEYVTLCALS